MVAIRVEAASDERRIAQARDLARRFVDEAAGLDAALGHAHRARQRRLRTLVRDSGAAEFTVGLTDEVTRIDSPERAARRFADLVGAADLSAMSRIDRAMLTIGAGIARIAPRLVIPLVQRRLRREARGVILSADDPDLADYLAACEHAGVRCNVNVLGEAILGDDEADRRLEMVLDRLRRPDVDYVSVKISAICAGIDVLAFDDTVERVTGRLRPLYRLAASFQPSKFVNLDMEEYRDLDLTIASFRRLLDEPELEHLDAGIVLQAYLPEAQARARELGEWAVRRREHGGGRTKIRLVKGANLAMETVEAEIHGWTPAPFPDKAAVDANYKAVLDVLCEQQFDDAIRVGVASHNLFDVAWAIGLRDEMVGAGRPSRIEFEMLQGMAPSQFDVVRATTGDMLVYSPVVRVDDFPAAIAYLVRRLDENTSPENFLAHIFDLATDAGVFEREAARFATAVANRSTVDVRERRCQDRGELSTPDPVSTSFANAPDTDWASAANRAWIAAWLAAERSRDQTEGDDATAGPITVGVVEDAIATASGASDRWSASPIESRAEIVDRVGQLFEANRGRVLAVMAADAGKTIRQGDPEVSEAIDFARYYAREALRLASIPGVTNSPQGVVVVAPPWNFPFAIPAGGVLASLAAGNASILKPAPQSVRTASLIAELCWEAGVPRDVLQFVPAGDDAAGRRLITHPDVDVVILTGAFETAAMFHSWRPDLRLHAETSGKNSMVVTATADRDHAVADLVYSAFGHAGQKCSAVSLAIVEAPLHDDRAFLERIRDAAATLRVGAADDFTTDVGPLIGPPGTNLLRALTTLEPGESWLLEPEQRSDDGRLWSPGIRLGVRPGSWFARTECFGPVLGIVRADDLDDAIAIQNMTEFGLTAGLHALDPVEVAHWTDRVEAGNLYVNRGVTGAIVRRQPFGGWKRSVVGPTAKAGGPNYVSTLCRWTDDARTPIDEVANRFDAWMRTVGSVEEDPTGLRAEHNGFRYRPLPGAVAVRYGAGSTSRQRELVGLAAQTTRCRLVESQASVETVEAFAARIGDLGVDRLRLLGVDDDPAIDILRAAAHAADIAVDDGDPVGAPEIELPRWLREQSVTVTMHRHGRVGAAATGATSVVAR
jgi:RHH-type transcriptional regulator, proline utilization regulon repressor / proline dehydrogenase / delta 1-pyrroline-5-carboxylate dehydrogenase